MSRSNYCPKKDEVLHSRLSDCLHYLTKHEYDMNNAWGL
jgi:hypothetical protein